MNAPELHAFRVRFASEWIALTSLRSQPPPLDSLISYSCKRHADTQLFQVACGQEDELSAFELFLRGLPHVTKIERISLEEFLVVPEEQAWRSKRR